MGKAKLRQELLEQEHAKPELARMRAESAIFVAKSFREFGDALQVSGQLIGPDRVDGLSPFQFGSDEVYGVSLLLRIGAELCENTVKLFEEQQTYAASALLRQIVEVEYLAWAFDKRDGDAEKWLRSGKDERWKIFRPAKIREAAGSTFRSKDYGYHCDMGGHPTPSAMTLLKNDSLVTQLLISDLLGHMLGIWGYFVGWGKQYQELEGFFRQYQPLGEATGKCLQTWNASDPLVDLGPPP